MVARREGRCVILEPPDDWPTSFLSALGAWPEDIERPWQAGLAALKGAP